MSRYITALLLLTLCLVFVSGGKAEETEEGRQQFAQKAADALDNTILQIKNGFSSFIEDGAKIGNFLSNVTDRFNKLSRGEPAKADEA